MKQTKKYSVYILRCVDDTLYTGVTTDVARRLREHQSGKGGSYTRAHLGKEIVYVLHKLTHGDALRREVQIKKLSRAAKLELINGPELR